MYPTAIVVHDPRGEIPDGTVLAGAALVRRHHDAGVVVLPYDPDRMDARLGSYCRIGWGEGRLVVAGKGERVCPMLVSVVPDRSSLYWVACCVAETVAAGSLATARLLSTPSESDVSVNLSAIDGVGEARAEGILPGQWFVLRGKRRVAADEPGLLAVDLFMVATSVRVLVSAVSQSRIDVAHP